jgi:hypothetical protein
MNELVSRPAFSPYADSAIWALFIVAFALTPLADFLSIRTSSGVGVDGGARYSLLVRGFVVGALAFALLISGRVKGSSCVRVLLAVAPICVVASMAVGGNLSGDELTEQIVFICKVFSFFVFVAALSSLSDVQLARLEPFIVGALLVYAAAILLGAGLSIDAFRSYQSNTQIRSGYKGIVYAQNEASALMITGLAYAYSRVLRLGWSSSIALIIVVLVTACMLIGTKAAAAGAFLIVCAYLYSRHTAVSASFRAGFVILVLFALGSVAYLTVPSIHDAITLTCNYFLYHYQRANNDAVLTILFSGRNVKFTEILSGLSDYGYLPILTGGYPVTRYLVEIDVPDLILCLGLPVFCCYLFALRQEFVTARNSALGRYSRLFFFVLLAVACSAGHTLNSAVVSPYLAFIAVSIRRYA